MDVWQTIGGGTGTLTLGLNCYQYVTGERQVLLRYVVSTIEQIVWRIPGACEAILHEAFCVTTYLLSTAGDAILDITSEGRSSVARGDAGIAIRAVIGEAGLVGAIAEARGVAMAVIPRVRQRRIAATHQLIATIVAVSGRMAIDGHAGAVAVFASIVARRRRTTTVLGAKTVTVGIGTDGCARQTSGFVVSVRFASAELGAVLDVTADVASDTIGQGLAGTEFVGVTVFPA